MISSDTIYKTLIKAGIKENSITFLDSSYSVPSLDWTLKASYSISNQIKSMLGDWIPEARDCDDFAFATFSLMRLAHSKSGPATTLAVGYFQFFSDKMKGYHAINIVFIDKEKLVFIEPQSGELLPLTAKEIKSCTRLVI